MWITKESVYALYNEYKKENNCIDLPRFDLDISYSVGAFAMFDLNELLKGKYILHVNHLISTYEDIFTKSILYHEFTHFYDFIHNENNFSRDDMFYLMRSYSEFHASQKEILFQIEKTNPKTIEDEALFKTNEKCDILEYVASPLSDLLSNLNKEKGSYKNLSELEVATKFHYSEKALFYYLGKLSIAIQQFPNKIKNDIPDINPVFYNDINQIKIILDLSPNIKDTIKILGKSLDSFERDFKLYFKCDEDLIG